MRLRFRGKRSGPLPEIEIPAEDRLKLGHLRDPTLARLFAAIDEAAPETAVLYVEGTRIPTEIRDFLEQRRILPAAVPTAGTIFPRPAKFHMPLRKENLRQLRALAKRSRYASTSSCTKANQSYSTPTTRATAKST